MKLCPLELQRAQNFGLRAFLGAVDPKLELFGPRLFQHAVITFVYDLSCL